MIDAALRALRLNACNPASVHVSLVGLTEAETRFDDKEVAVGDALAAQLNQNALASIVAMHRGYRAVAAMSDAEPAAQIGRCDVSLSAILP